MKIKELIYNTPEMSEEKLLDIMSKNIEKLKIKGEIIDRLSQLHKGVGTPQSFLDEYDLIQDKKSYLTKSQREYVTGFVGFCMIEMTKGNEVGNE